MVFIITCIDFEMKYDQVLICFSPAQLFWKTHKENYAQKYNWGSNFITRQNRSLGKDTKHVKLNMHT